MPHYIRAIVQVFDSAGSVARQEMLLRYDRSTLGDTAPWEPGPDYASRLHISVAIVGLLSDVAFPNPKKSARRTIKKSTKRSM